MLSYINIYVCFCILTYFLDIYQLYFSNFDIDRYILYKLLEEVGFEPTCDIIN